MSCWLFVHWDPETHSPPIGKLFICTSSVNMPFLLLIMLWCDHFMFYMFSNELHILHSNTQFLNDQRKSSQVISKKTHVLRAIRSPHLYMFSLCQIFLHRLEISIINDCDHLAVIYQIYIFHSYWWLSRKWWIKIVRKVVGWRKD